MVDISHSNKLNINNMLMKEVLFIYLFIIYLFIVYLQELNRYYFNINYPKSLIIYNNILNKQNKQNNKF